MYQIEFTFPASKSLVHPRALEIARQGTAFSCQEIDQFKLYHAVFDLHDFTQANLALEISQLLRGLRGVAIRHGGTVAPNPFGMHFWFSDILQCYVQSMSSTDYRAHCWKMVSIMVPSGADEIRISPEYLFSARKAAVKEVYICYPCARALHERRMIDLRHPATIRDQLKSIAVKACVDWCPAFDLMAAIEETRRIIHTNVLIDSSSKDNT